MPRTAALTLASTAAAIVLLAGCTASTGDAQSVPTSEPSTAAPAPASTPTPDPSPTPEPEPAPTEVGQTVPAGQVDVAREAGAAVYVSPNGDGEGVVVEPGTTPDIIIAELQEAHAPGMGTLDDFDAVLAAELGVYRAAEAADIGAFILSWAPSFGADGSVEQMTYVVTGVGAVEQSEEAGKDNRRPTKEAAVAAMQHVIDRHLGYELIDLTD